MRESHIVNAVAVQPEDVAVGVRRVIERRNQILQRRSREARQFLEQGLRLGLCEGAHIDWPVLELRRMKKKKKMKMRLGGWVNRCKCLWPSGCLGVEESRENFGLSSKLAIRLAA